MSCKLFINNNRKSKEKNLQLMKFLTNNVDELVNAGFIFHIIKVNSKNMHSLKREGVHATPALKNEEGVVVGNNGIIKFLIESCEPPQAETSRVVSKKNSPAVQEDVKDMLMDIINDYTEDDEEEAKDKIKTKIESELAKRTNNVPSSNKRTQAPVVKRQDPADDVMDKYWENMEETDV